MNRKDLSAELRKRYCVDRIDPFLLDALTLCGVIGDRCEALHRHSGQCRLMAGHEGSHEAAPVMPGAAPFHWQAARPADPEAKPLGHCNYVDGICPAYAQVYRERDAAVEHAKALEERLQAMQKDLDERRESGARSGMALVDLKKKLRGLL